MIMHNYKNIKGLHLYKSFFENDLMNNLIVDSVNLYFSIVSYKNSQNMKNKAFIPQPNSIKSHQHNLSTEEYYTSLVIHQLNKKLKCEHFDKYGDKGHLLTYFRNNENIPDFIEQLINSHFSKIDFLITKYATQSSKRFFSQFNWKLTTNYYLLNPELNQVAGFPFHIDIPANGEITMILNFHAPGHLQFKYPNQEEIHDIELEKGDLLMLTDESRYDYMHRVVPIANNNVIGDNLTELIYNKSSIESSFISKDELYQLVSKIKRISFVLGLYKI